jgi:hypothetical protein
VSTACCPPAVAGVSQLVAMCVVTLFENRPTLCRSGLLHLPALVQVDPKYIDSVFRQLGFLLSIMSAEPPKPLGIGFSYIS